MSEKENNKKIKKEAREKTLEPAQFDLDRYHLKQDRNGEYYSESFANDLQNIHGEIRDIFMTYDPETVWKVINIIQKHGKRWD